MKKTVPILLLVLGGFALGFFLWWQNGLSPARAGEKATQTFVIARGDGVREIARKLHDQGLVKDQIAFFLLIKKLGIEKDIQAGSFRLSPGQSANQIAVALTKGTEDQWVTIVEGLRSEEILEQLEKEKIDPGQWTV